MLIKSVFKRFFFFVTLLTANNLLAGKKVILSFPVPIEERERKYFLSWSKYVFFTGKKAPLFYQLINSYSSIDIIKILIIKAL